MDCNFRSLILVFGFLSLAITHGAKASEVSRINGISPETATTLPGVAELFRISSASETPVIADGQDYIEDELVVRFLLDLSDKEIEDIAIEIGAVEWIRKSPLGLFVLRTPTSIKGDMEAMMGELWETGMTVSISPNYTVVQPLYLPNDPVLGDQWYLDKLGLSDAWDITRGSSSVVVAVIDSGLSMGHPEFSGRIFVNSGEIPGNGIDDDDNDYVDDISGWDTMEYDPPYYGDNDPTDPTTSAGLGHGTWVSSILMANANNSFQIAGFDHFVKILPLRCFANPVTQGHWQYGEIAAAMDYVIRNPEFVQIVNMSFGGLLPGNSLTSQALAGMADTAILVTGSGNSYQFNGPGEADVNNPAAHPDVITVAGTDDDDNRAAFSDTGNSVQFAAPAVDIVAASFRDLITDDAFDSGDGTSFAAPMVTGIATLGMALRPGLTKAELVEALKDSAVDLGSPGRDSEFGWGRVNAHGALLVIDSIIFIDGFETGNTSRWN